MSTFTPSRCFRRDYDRLFKKDPAVANLFLMICEMADEKGQVMTDEKELAQLMTARFDDPRTYQLPGGAETMTDHVPGGSFLMARTIYQSAIWKKHPQYFRLFFWLIGNANFEDGYTFKGHALLRGQLITTYAAIADALSYCFNKSVIKPTIKEIRVMLFWLQSEGMILVKPLIDGTSPHKGRPIELTRAYVGLLILLRHIFLHRYEGCDMQPSWKKKPCFSG